MPGSVLRGIELIYFCGRDWRVIAAGPQILRMHVGVAAEELHFTPASPATLVATVRLSIRHCLTQLLERGAQTRRIQPRRLTRRTLHAANLWGLVVMLPGLRSRPRGLPSRP